jgi:hypothetical protein
MNENQIRSYFGFEIAKILESIKGSIVSDPLVESVNKQLGEIKELFIKNIGQLPEDIRKLKAKVDPANRVNIIMYYTDS